LGGLVVLGAGHHPSALETPRPARIEPLAPARYRVQFTASAQLRGKLERLRALMRSSVPDGDLAAVIEAAVTEKLERLEARRFGRTRKPRPAIGTRPAAGTRPAPGTRGSDGDVPGGDHPGSELPTGNPAGASSGLGSADLAGSALASTALASSEGQKTMGESPLEKSTSPLSRYLPAAVRRVVYERDGGQCRYVDAQGRRCTAREGLEFHHRHPFGFGGEHSPSNVCVFCEQHNRFVAETDYGRRAMARYRRRR
jgi:hypothetical protein